MKIISISIVFVTHVSSVICVDTKYSNGFFNYVYCMSLGIIQGFVVEVVWGYEAPGVGHASVSDIDTTSIITLNYVISSNYYPCQWPCHVRCPVSKSVLHKHRLEGMSYWWNHWESLVQMVIEVW